MPPAIVEQFVASVLPLIQHKARTKSRQSGAPIEDLVQSAAMACWRQLPRFDASRGLKLTSWLQYRIDGAMKDYLRDNGYFLHGGRRSGRKEQRVTLDARWPNGRAVMETEDVMAADVLRRRRSLDRFHELLEPLPQRERLIVLMRYRDDCTMKQIGDSLGLSESRISQIISAVLARLQPLATRRFLLAPNVGVSS